MNSYRQFKTRSVWSDMFLMSLAKLFYVVSLNETGEN